MIILFVREFRNKAISNTQPSTQIPKLPHQLFTIYPNISPNTNSTKNLYQMLMKREKERGRGSVFIRVLKPEHPLADADADADAVVADHHTRVADAASSLCRVWNRVCYARSKQLLI